MGKYPWTVYVESKPEKLQPGGKATFAVDIRNTGNQPHQPEITLDFWLQRAYTPNENPLVKAEDTTAGIATIPKMTSPSRNFKPQDPHITWVDNDHNAVRYIITTANPLPAGDTISFDLLDMPIADGEGKGRLDVLLGSVDERTKGDWEQPQPQYFEKTSTAVTASRSERLLRFEMVDGDPINAGKKGGFTFRVYPEKNQDVSCARISVSAETGEKPTSLCSSAADLQNCPKPPTGWKKAPNKKTGELWAFVPDGIRESAPQVQTFKKGKQILFPFSDVPFSEIPGEVTLTFRAESAEKSGHTASEETIIPKALTKHAAGFEFAHFAPTFPAVEHGTPAQFTWHAQGVIKYILHTPEGISIENPARSDTTFRTHALTKSTGFVLEAFSEGFLSHRLGTTVAHPGRREHQLRYGRSEHGSENQLQIPPHPLQLQSQQGTKETQDARITGPDPSGKPACRHRHDQARDIRKEFCLKSQGRQYQPSGYLSRRLQLSRHYIFAATRFHHHRAQRRMEEG